jgi:outer membrane protein assembly factor BamB
MCVPVSNLAGSIVMLIFHLTMRACLMPAAWLLACAALVSLRAQDAGRADPIEGVWTGTVGSPQGEVAEIGFEFLRDRQGALTFRFHFPAMFTYAAGIGLPVTTEGDGNYRTPFFDTRFRLQGDRLVGTFTAGGLPLALQRGGVFSARPEMPRHPPAPDAHWRYALGAATWAPPTADGGVVYVGARDGRLHAVRATDGAPLWVWSGAAPIDGGVAVDAGSVYLLDTRFNLVALDRQTGNLRWRQPLHNEFFAGGSVPDNPTFNHRAATPLLYDGALYVGSGDGGLYAVDAVTGAVRWRHDARAPVYSGVGLQGRDALLFGTMDGSLVRLDRHTRQETLRLRTGGGVVTTPVVAGDRLVAGSRDYLLHAVDLDGNPAWRFSYWFSWIESTPALRDGLLYLGGSDYARISAIDPATGRARWSTVVHGLSWGTPLVTERHVFAGTVNQNLPGTLIDHRAGLVKLDRATGAVRWRLELPRAPEGQFAGYAGGPVLADGKVVVAGLDGWLAAFPED